ncbi:MAG: MFS transporter [Candidatus Puniceispirillum sp.]|jgi:MFS family permease|nr:MFS transporter [Candidatus Puniceispirillum sp.]
MLRSVIASWTLFFGLLMISAGSGLQNVLLGTRAPELGFSNIATGFVMSGYYAGIFAGSIIVPHILAQVGHVRVFGAMAAIASAAVLMHVAFADPILWAVMRLFSGFSFAGMYIVCESWLNEKATNETRGQLLSLYMIINMAGMGGGQLMIGLGATGGIGLFLLASVMVSIAVVPILITVSVAPNFEAPERLSFRRILQVSPLSVFGMAFIGLVVSMLFGMGPVYGRNLGLDNTEIGYFMTSIMVGTLLLQYPVGRLSDKFDRRAVILGASASAAVCIAIASFFDANQFILLLIFTMVFGGLTFSLYSLFIAHANDFLPPSQMVAVSSGLLMVNGAGAVVGSPFAATIIEVFGSRSFMPAIALILVVISGFVLLRMRMRDAVPTEAQGPFVAFPETLTSVAAGLNPEAEWTETAEEEDAADPFKDNPYIN